MKIRNYRILNYFAIGLVYLLVAPVFVQTQPQTISNENYARDILNDIEVGIQRNDVDIIAGHFLKQLSLSLPGTESGIYSTNQAISILQNYFNTLHVISFKFTTIQDRTEMPYATGGGVYVARGKKESFQVYVALRAVHGTWIVTQFNVY
jgi:hypothetical protein